MIKEDNAFKYEIEENKLTGEKIYKIVLEDGLKVYICPKKGYSKKIGMYGTHFGSIDTTFFDVLNNTKTKVPDGIAHFLEHKLFEQEDGNALDVFAKMGVSSNAYTAYDHTVYFFETNDKFEKCVNVLFEFITTPYFTDENVEKEKGIIEQELKMYEDSADSVVYYNCLKNMYNSYPLNVDIGGTVDSVYSITKDELYSCYASFYNPQNMFVILVGDIDVDRCVELVSTAHAKTNKYKAVLPQRFYPEEKSNIAEKESTKKLDIYMPNICVGFKLGKKTGTQNVKDALITEFINTIYFSELSDFYEEMYKAGLLTSPMYLTYESGVDFSHMLVFFQSLEYAKCEEKLKKHIESIKEKGITFEMLEIAKNKRKGEIIYNSEEPMNITTRVINSIIDNSKVYEDAFVIDSITVEDVNSYIKTGFDMEKMVVSRVVPKEKNM